MGRRKQFSKITVVESGKPNRPVIVSKSAEKLLLAIANEKAQGRDVSVKSASKKAGVSFGTSQNYIRELNEKLGAGLVFPKGRYSHKDRLIRFLPLSRGRRIKDKEEWFRKKLEQDSLKEIRGVALKKNEFRMIDLGSVSEKDLEREYLKRKSELNSILGGKPVRDHIIPKGKQSRIGIARERMLIGDAVSAEKAEALIEITQDNRRELTNIMKNPHIYGGLKALASKYPEEYLIMNNSLYRRQKIDRETVLVKVVPLDRGKAIAREKKVGEIVELDGFKARVIAVNGVKIAVPERIAEKMSTTLEETAGPSTVSGTAGKKAHSSLKKQGNVEERVYEAFKELEKEGCLSLKSIAEKAGTTPNSAGVFLTRLRKKTGESLSIR